MDEQVMFFFVNKQQSWGFKQDNSRSSTRFNHQKKENLRILVIEHGDLSRNLVSSLNCLNHPNWICPREIQT